MNTILTNSNIKKKFGQGMTEYIIIVALVAVAAIGAFKMFGQTAQSQIAGLSAELAGTNSDDATSRAASAAEEALEQASQDRAMGTYGGGNDASAE